MTNLKRLMSTIWVVLLFAACSEEDTITDMRDAFGIPPTLTEVSKEQFLSQGQEMLDDNESIDEMTSSDRFFRVNEPIKASITSDGKLRLYNFMACNFKNVEVWFSMPSMKDTLRIVRFQEVPAMYDIRIESPFKMGEVVYESKSGKPVKLKNLALLNPSQYSLHVSCEDRVFSIIKTIKSNTLIQFGRYGEGNWGLLNPHGARYMAIGAVQMAAFFSSDAFRDSIMNTKEFLHDDAGVALDRELLIRQILNKEKLVLGLVTGSGPGYTIDGLGGGEAFGIRESLLPNMYFHNRVVLQSDYVANVWIHEFGHTIGYGHSSSMCYGVISDVLGPKIYRIMMLNKLLPYVVDPFKIMNDYNPDATTRSADVKRLI